MEMTLMKQLEKTEHSSFYVETVVETLKHERESGKTKIYVFGAGSRAIWLSGRLSKRGVDTDGFLVNRKYWTADVAASCENRVYCYEDKVNSGESMVIVLGCPSSLLNMKMFDVPAVQKVIPISLGVMDDYLMAWETCQAHADELDWLYNRCADEASRQNLLKNLQGRLTGQDIQGTPSGWTDPQYFLPEFMKWQEEECLMDGGAYIGDTVEEFLRKKPDSVRKYKAYAWEPDPENFETLKSSYAGNPNVIPINKGMYSKEDTLYFRAAQSGDKERDRLSGEGDTAVPVSTIDLIAGEDRVTFIKMDVEGSELEALKGARRQIEKNRPRLAVCLYHKQEDMWTIPQFIDKLCPDYRFYLRPHSSMPTELVLFCMPG